MKKVSALLALLAFGLPGLRAQPIPLYENFGTVFFGEVPPQIDAIAFANYGTFNILTPSILPFDFQNTRFYTNRGTMQGNIGFQFDTSFSKGQRIGALNFENQRGATIVAAPWLTVNSSNVLNQGLLSTSSDGLLRLQGGSINVSRSGLEIQPAGGAGGGGFVTPTNFIPSPGIFDLYWGGITNDVIDSQGLLQPFGVSSGAHIVTTAFGGIQFVSVNIFEPETAVFTNEVSPTNFVVQAAFVGVPTSGNYSASLRFGNPSFTGLRPIFVQLSMDDTNVVTEEVFSHNLFFADRMAASTNYVMATNLATGVTFRPAIYELSRTPPNGFAASGPPNAEFSPDIFENEEFEQDIVTNLFAAYGAQIASQGTTTIPHPLATVTNNTGRVEIESDSLDLNRTRIRGNGLVSIKTKHLVSSENTVVDCGNLIYHLASTNGTLRIENLTKEFVVRQSGVIQAWSAIWTNTTLTTTSTPDPDTNNPPVMTTNTVQHLFHVLFLDASGMQSIQPVTVHELTGSATNIVLRDNMNVVTEFALSGHSVTLDSEIFLVGDTNTTRHWTTANAPGVNLFTNLGTLWVQDTANFGNDRPTPYGAFVNRGIVDVTSLIIHADYLENAGTFESVGGLTAQANVAKFEGGSHNTGGDAVLRGQDYKFHQYAGLTGGRLIFDVTQSLADSGGDANNTFTVSDGFFMSRKPVSGDLLGTTLQTVTPRFASVDHVWAASDRGAIPAGFSNNVAIGRLAMSGGSDTLLNFRGPDNTGAYAIYADFLDLQGNFETAFLNNDLASVLTLAPNLTIYYAYANVPVEQLDGQFDGQFQWVKDFAGPNSSIDVALRSGKTIRVNRGLRESLIIDSDGDGIANGLDPSPFDEPEIEVTVSQVEPFTTEITWVAAPLTTYVVEFATEFNDSNWQPLDTVSNPTATRQTLSTTDEGGNGHSQRYYRVRYSP